MLTYSFSDIGSDSLYGHLYKCIKNDIIKGNLAPGEKLPSKRSFAKNLGISVITIENAYEQLIAEGYIYSLPKKGYFVADISSNPNSIKTAVNDADILPFNGEPEYKADFASNHVPAGQFPFSVWTKILREILRNSQEELLMKSPSSGTLRLRKSISEYMREFRGMNVNPNQIIIGAGTENLYAQIVQLLGRDKSYGIEDPGYQKISLVYDINGAKCHHIKLDDDGISIEELERQNVQVAHISPSHHFPTGLVTPVSKRYELLGWATKDKNRYIIEDDYDSEFRLTGKPLPTLQSIDTTEKVIYMNTFSKSLSATMRVSFMVLPWHLTELYRQKMWFYTCPVPNLIQSTLARFMDEGYFEKHINRMRNYYKKQRDILIEEIKNSPMEKYVSISEADAGLHFILRLNISCSDDDFKMRMQRRGIKICPLSDYFANPENRTQHSFVINYSSLTKEQIKWAVAKMSEEVLSVRPHPL